MKFTTEHRAKLESMMIARETRANQKQAIRAALERIDELEAHAKFLEAAGNLREALARKVMR